MTTSILSYDQKLFALKRLLASCEEKGNWKPYSVKRPNLLLSQVKGVDRDIVDVLEYLGIYDTEDLQQLSEDQINELSVPKSKFLEFEEVVLNEVQRKMDVPRIILDLPENFAFLSIATGANYHALAVIWKEVLFSWMCPSNEGWHVVKLAFDEFSQEIGHPEFITSFGYFNSYPNWIEPMNDISIYLSNIYPGDTIEKRVLSMGFPEISINSVKHKAEIQVMKISYLIDLAQMYQHQLDQLS